MVHRTATTIGQRGFTLVELLAVMAIMSILAGVVAGAVVGLGSKGQMTRLEGDRNTIAKSADRFFTDAFPQTYPVVDIDTNGDGDVDEDDDLVSIAGDLDVRLIDFDAIIPQDATLSFVPDFLKEVPDSAALVSWRVDQATGNVFFAEDGAALVRPSLARLDVKATDPSLSLEGDSTQSDHTFTLTMRQGEAPINSIEMTIPAGYVIGGQQLAEDLVVGSLEITFEANNPWDTGNDLTVTTVPVVVVSGNRWQAEVNYDQNTGGTTEDINVKNSETGTGEDIRIHTIRVSPPSGANSSGALIIKLDRVTEDGALDVSDYEDPDVNEATEIFVLTLYDHPKVSLGGADVAGPVNLITNPETKGVFRWLAEQNTAIDLEGFFDGLAGNQAVVIKPGSSSSSSSEPPPSGGPTILFTYEEGFTGFASAPGTEWSPQSSDSTPAGGEEFLGPFDDQTASLSPVSLPAHTQVTVEFDLYIIGSWDGNTETIESSVVIDPADVWDLSIFTDPVPLLRTTFSNNATDNQAFPGDYLVGSFPAQTDSVEQNTLGYITDSVYHLSFTFNHTGPVIRLDFSGSGLDSGPPPDDTWGLDDVVFTVY